MIYNGYRLREILSLNPRLFVRTNWPVFKPVVGPIL